MGSLNSIKGDIVKWHMITYEKQNEIVTIKLHGEKETNPTSSCISPILISTDASYLVTNWWRKNP